MVEGDMAVVVMACWLVVGVAAESMQRVVGVCRSIIVDEVMVSSRVELVKVGLRQVVRSDAVVMTTTTLVVYGKFQRGLECCRFLCCHGEGG